MHIDVNSGIKEVSFSAKIIRADGTVEDLGVVAQYSKNPIKNLFFKLKRFLKKLLK